MIKLPILNSLDVTGYGLYPGETNSEPGLHVSFKPGLTLVLGANGLGKTTLVMLLYRLLVGPSDISVLMGGAELGTARLQEVTLSNARRRTFAQRVSDGAANANAQLGFEVGGERVIVERNLRNMGLRSFKVGNESLGNDESRYKSEVCRLANVSAFSDWILLLRYIVFYFEDRRSLVWDRSAQRQLLRILFLEPDQASDWTAREREILEDDSEVRNLHVVASSEEQHLVADEVIFASGPAIREELQELEEQQRKAYGALDEINSRVADVEAQHESARLRFLTLEQERESRYRELEHARLRVVSARMPGQTDSARYIMGRLLAEAECLVCGSNVPSVMRSMESRIREHACVICGSDLNPGNYQDAVAPDEGEIAGLGDALQKIDAELGSARETLDDSEIDRNDTVVEIQRLRTAISERTARLQTLLRRLPPEEGALHERRREFSSLRGRIEVLQRELSEKRRSFAEIVTKANATIERQSMDVQDSFAEYAHQFLFEECRLVWSPQPARLGQTGRRFEFPSFELELGGSDFSSTVRRGGPEDVSESQREFIDISFRIALAQVAAEHGATSLVMDAPESSLDAVFVNRAASVLGAFARREPANRLIATSNLVSGDLIPALLREGAADGDHAGRVVNLLAIAAPTAAVRDLREEYDEILKSFLEQAQERR